MIRQFFTSIFSFLGYNPKQTAGTEQNISPAKESTDLPEPADLLLFSRDFDGFLKWRKVESERYRTVSITDSDRLEKEEIAACDALLQMASKLGRPQEAMKIKIPGTTFCGCVTSYLNPSWASSVHDILFHVCQDHANYFNIHSGPYWRDTIQNPNRNSSAITSGETLH